MLVDCYETVWQIDIFNFSNVGKYTRVPVYDCSCFYIAESDDSSYQKLRDSYAEETENWIPEETGSKEM